MKEKRYICTLIILYIEPMCLNLKINTFYTKYFLIKKYSFIVKKNLNYLFLFIFK